MFISLKGALVIGRTNRAESGKDETVLEQALGKFKNLSLIFNSFLLTPLFIFKVIWKRGL